MYRSNPSPGAYVCIGVILLQEPVCIGVILLREHVCVVAILPSEHNILSSCNVVRLFSLNLSTSSVKLGELETLNKIVINLSYQTYYTWENYLDNLYGFSRVIICYWSKNLESIKSLENIFMNLQEVSAKFWTVYSIVLTRTLWSMILTLDITLFLGHESFPTLVDKRTNN